MSAMVAEVPDDAPPRHMLTHRLRGEPAPVRNPNETRVNLRQARRFPTRVLRTSKKPTLAGSSSWRG